MTLNEHQDATLVERESDLPIIWAAIEERLFHNKTLHSGKRVLALENGLYVIRER